MREIEEKRGGAKEKKMRGTLKGDGPSSIVPVQLRSSSLALSSLLYHPRLPREGVETLSSRQHIELKKEPNSHGRRRGESRRGFGRGALLPPPTTTTRATSSTEKKTKKNNRNRARFGARPRSTQRLQRIAAFRLRRRRARRRSGGARDKRLRASRRGRRRKTTTMRSAWLFRKKM